MTKIVLTLVVILSASCLGEAQIDLAPLQQLNNAWFPNQQNQVKQPEYDAPQRQADCVYIPVYSPWTGKVVRYEVHCD